MSAPEAIDAFFSGGRHSLRSAWQLLAGVGLLAASSILLLVLPPHLYVAAALAVAVTLMLIVHPRGYLMLYLATGALNLAIFASERRELLPSLGGMEPDGLRLLAFTTGGLLLLFLRPRLLVIVSRYRLALAFVLVLALSLLYSTSLPEGGRLLLKISFPLLTYVIVISEVRTEKHIDAVLRACLVGIGFACFVSLVRISTGDSLYIDDAGGIPRFQGPMGASTMAFYGTCVSLLLYCYGTMQGRKRWLPIVGAIIMAGFIAVTGTRVGVAGFLLAVIAVEWVRNRLRRGYFIAAAGLVTIAILTPLFQRFAYSRDIHDLSGLTFGGGFWGILSAVDTSGRDMLWRRLWEDMVMTSPFVGHGLGSANDYLTSLVGRPMVPHGELLRLLADTGIVGTTLAISLAIRVWLRLSRTRLPMDDRYEFLRPLALGLFVAFIVFSMTDNILEYYAIFMGYFATFAGLLHVRAKQVTGSTDEA